LNNAWILVHTKSGTTYLVTQRHIPEDLILQQHRCDNVKSGNNLLHCWQQVTQYTWYKWTLGTRSVFIEVLVIKCVGANTVPLCSTVRHTGSHYWEKLNLYWK